MGSDELSAALWMLGRDLSPPRRSSSRRQQGHCCDALRELSPPPLGCSPFHSTHFSSRGPSAFPSLFRVSGSEGQESSLALGMRVVRKPCEVLGATNTERQRVALRRTGPKWPLHGQLSSSGAAHLYCLHFHGSNSYVGESVRQVPRQKRPSPFAHTSVCPISWMPGSGVPEANKTHCPWAHRELMNNSTIIHE